MPTVYTYVVDHGDKRPQVAANDQVNGGRLIGVSFCDLIEKNAALENALESLLAEVVSMREDYPAEAWRFSQETINNAENALA